MPDLMSALYMKNVSKIYKNTFSKERVTAVDSLNINISKGDCCGLIGVNGAGKTTAFQIIAGNVALTKGNVSIGKYSLKKNRGKYLKLLGYCPQFDAFGDYLTSRQALTFFCKLRNIYEKNEINNIVERMLTITGLRKYADISSYQYSGGNKRKLSLALALIGLDSIDEPDLAVILLDEPTSGVDPKSRRLIHKMIEELHKSGKTIILSSHSLGECESLCNEVGIMEKGNIRYFDKIQKVKKELGRGYSLTMRLKIPLNDVNDETDASTSRNDEIKTDDLLVHVKEKFSELSLDAELRDKYETILQFVVKDNADLPYSQVFSTMEAIRAKFENVIEDYAICGLTLEDAFFAYINSKQETNDTPPV